MAGAVIASAALEAVAIGPATEGADRITADRIMAMAGPTTEADPTVVEDPTTGAADRTEAADRTTGAVNRTVASDRAVVNPMAADPATEEAGPTMAEVNLAVAAATVTKSIAAAIGDA